MRFSGPARDMRGALGVAALFVVLAVTGGHARAGDGGVLFVKSDPAGASIWIDGTQTRWVTPRIVGDLSPGKHVVLLKLDGRTDARADVDVEAGKILTVDLPLPQPRGASLRIESEPGGAMVWVDTVERGVTPVTVADLAAGPHVIVAMLDGYAIVEKQVSVERGASDTLRLALVKEGAPAGAGSAVVPEEPPKAGQAVVEQKATDVPKTVDVECPYCRGNGVIKSMGCFRCARTGVALLDDCPSCGGKGELEVTCPACTGQGKVVSGGREYDCRACKGKGFPACVACRGEGNIQKPNPAAAKGATRPCSACGSTGFEQRIKCLACRGTGASEGMPGVSVDFMMTARRAKCVLCGGDGVGPPVCTQCKGRGSFGTGANAQMCKGCYGTGHTHVNCSACSGRGFVFAK